MTATGWDELHGQPRHRPRFPSDHVIRFLAHLPVRDGFALDIGCGTGRHLRALAEFGFTPVGVDASTTAVRDLPNAYVGDMTALPFDTDSFDLALAVGVFYYGAAAAGRQAAAELHRVLRPAGHALVVCRTTADWRRHGVPVGEPEHGMEMHFLAELEIPVRYQHFTDVTWERAEWTQDGMARLNSDWLIHLVK